MFISLLKFLAINLMLRSLYVNVKYYCIIYVIPNLKDIYDRSDTSHRKGDFRKFHNEMIRLEK